MKQFISWRQAIPTLFTIGAMLAGFISILVTVEGLVQHAGDPREINSLFRLAYGK